MSCSGRCRTSAPWCRRCGNGRRRRRRRPRSRRSLRSSSSTRSPSSTRSTGGHRRSGQSHDVSLTIEHGEVVGLVGESGSGKTTIGRAIIGLLPFVDGSARVLGTDMVGISKADLKKVRRELSFVFQDPGSSLNPRLPIGESIGEPLLLQDVAKGPALAKRVEALLDQVHLARDLRNRYPHELSGGQRQRVGIARALALQPPSADRRRTDVRVGRLRAGEGARPVPGAAA